MYYPKQIPYLLDKEFQDNVEYIEYRFEKLNDYCMCIWEMKSKKILENSIYNYILPDACIDIVIDFIKKQIMFAGFSKETELFELHGKVDYLGVRLKPSVFNSIYKVPSDKIMDKGIAFDELEKNASLDQIFLCNKNERINILKMYLEEKIKLVENKDFIMIIDKLYQNPKEQTVLKLVNEFGYNERQLLRIFKRSYGVSPKVLLNIIRLHFCIECLFEDDRSMSQIANMCGFYDQSHFIKEIKKYTGISPFVLLEKYKYRIK